ncbi:Bromodomain and WD repeat-containing protein 1 [Smittium culicis]|uniref:Bromodomain and WD repeat-containing protein 1 n=1 Tax=Smittium culicis TaxID=133412 RepID=A0A1R1YDF3_9FUNG|nr:Bromodomain and WD repeat-containing protein 1 [Smittium culicis]
MITGSDDYLVKIWCTRSGYLIQTLRGHKDVITDMSLNFENTLLASGSSDGTVRIWNLKTGKPEAVLTGSLNSTKKGIININFSPSPIPQIRYLAAVSEDDGKYTKNDSITSMTFNRTGSRLAFSTKNGYIQIVSFISEARLHKDDNSNPSLEKNDESSLAKLESGSFLVDHLTECSLDKSFSSIEIVEWGGPKPLSIFPAHSTSISTLVYSNDGTRLLSGAIDGSAYIWEFDKIGTVKNRINVGVGDVYCELNLQVPNFVDRAESGESTESSGHPGLGISVNPQNNENDYSKVIESNQVAWICDDSVVIVSNSVGLVSAFDSKTGNRLWATREHGFQEVFVLIAHPLDRRIAVSGGYNGHVVVWDVNSGNSLHTFYIDEQIFDGSFSDDGAFFAVVGETGAAYLFGNSESEKQYKNARRMPEQVFFSDYTSTIQDSQFHVIDEITQIAPHLMERGPLQDFDGRQFRIQKGPRFGMDLEVGLDPKKLQSFDQSRLLSLQEELTYVKLLSLAVNQTAKHNNPAAIAERSNASNTRAIYYAEGELPIYVQEDDEDDQDYSGIQDPNNDSQDDDVELILSEDDNENIVVRQHRRGDVERGRSGGFSTRFIPRESNSHNTRSSGNRSSNQQNSTRRSGRRGRRPNNSVNISSRSTRRQSGTAFSDEDSTHDLDDNDLEAEYFDGNELQNEIDTLYANPNGNNRHRNTRARGYQSNTTRAIDQSQSSQQVYMSLRNRRLDLNQRGSSNRRDPASRRAVLENLRNQRNRRTTETPTRPTRRSSRIESPPLYANNRSSNLQEHRSSRSRGGMPTRSMAPSESISNATATRTSTRRNLRSRQPETGRNSQGSRTSRYSRPTLSSDDTSDHNSMSSEHEEAAPPRRSNRKRAAQNLDSPAGSEESRLGETLESRRSRRRLDNISASVQTPSSTESKRSLIEQPSSSRSSRSKTKLNYNEASSDHNLNSDDNPDFDLSIKNTTPSKSISSAKTNGYLTRSRDNINNSNNLQVEQKTTRSGRLIKPSQLLTFNNSSPEKPSTSTHTFTPPSTSKTNANKSRFRKTVDSSSPKSESSPNSSPPVHPNRATSIKLKINENVPAGNDDTPNSKLTTNVPTNELEESKIKVKLDENDYQAKASKNQENSPTNHKKIENNLKTIKIKSTSSSKAPLATKKLRIKMDHSSDENENDDAYEMSGGSLVSSNEAFSKPRLKFVMENAPFNYFYKPQIGDEVICFKNSDRINNLYIAYSEDFDSGFLALDNESWIIGRITDITYQVDSTNSSELSYLLELETIMSKSSNRKQFVDLIQNNDDLSNFRFSESKKILKLNFTDSSDYFIVLFSKFKQSVEALTSDDCADYFNKPCWVSNFSDELEEFSIVGVENTKKEIIDPSECLMHLVYNPAKSIICVKKEFEGEFLEYRNMSDIESEKIKRVSIWDLSFYNQDDIENKMAENKLDPKTNKDLIKVIEKLIDNDEAEWFEYHVDFNDYPDYTNLIAYPICLDSILERLENNYYRNISAVHNDLYKIYLNASTYNKPGTIVPNSAITMLKIYVDLVKSSKLQAPTWVSEFDDYEMAEPVIPSRDSSISFVSHNSNDVKSKPTKGIEYGFSTNETFQESETHVEYQSESDSINNYHTINNNSSQSKRKRKIDYREPETEVESESNYLSQTDNLDYESSNETTVPKANKSSYKESSRTSIKKYSKTEDNKRYSSETKSSSRGVETSSEFSDTSSEERSESEYDFNSSSGSEGIYNSSSKSNRRSSKSSASKNRASNGSAKKKAKISSGSSPKSKPIPRHGSKSKDSSNKRTRARSTRANSNAPRYDFSSNYNSESE